VLWIRARDAQTGMKQFTGIKQTLRPKLMIKPKSTGLLHLINLNRLVIGCFLSEQGGLLLEICSGRRDTYK
jgi:hypothetical protein